LNIVITVQTIQTGGSTTNDAARKFARAMGKPTDDAGHIVGNQLRSTGRSLYNIFPQNPNINRGVWSQEENQILKLLFKSIIQQ
jgi:glycerate kinase